MRYRLDEVIKAYMQRHDIKSTRELSERFGGEISHAYISVLLNGHAHGSDKTIDPKISTLKLLAEKMNIRLEALLYAAGYIDEAREPTKEDFPDFAEVFEDTDLIMIAKEAKSEGISAETLRGFVKLIKDK